MTPIVQEILNLVTKELGPAVVREENGTLFINLMGTHMTHKTQFTPEWQQGFTKALWKTRNNLPIVLLQERAQKNSSNHWEKTLRACKQTAPHPKYTFLVREEDIIRY